MTVRAADLDEVAAWAEKNRARRVRRGRLRAVVLLAVLSALVAVPLAVLGAGTGVFVIESPSMGRAAPVGSLVVTEPTEVRRLQVGDVVTYRSAPSAPTTTHRVVRIVPDGASVQGDINGAPDALVVRQSMLVGRAVAVIPAVGRLIRLAPWFVIGIASVLLLTWPLRNEELRAALRTVGVSAVGTVLMLLQHPLLDWVVLSKRTVPRAMLLELVSTGLLPMRLTAWHGGSMTLVPGAVGTLRAPADAVGGVRFDAALGLPPWGWALLVLVCLAPMTAVMIVGLPPRGDDPLERPT